MSRSWTSGLLALGVLACSAEAPDSNTPSVPSVERKAPSTASVVAPASNMPAPRWRIEAPQPPVVEQSATQFAVTVDQIYLDGECSGEGKRRSDGIHLVLRGHLSHALDDRVHRATLTGVLFARFGEKVAFRKASGGIGFTVAVDSDHPWQPGETRAFEVETRTLDPIYCLYQPSALVAGIHLSAETPTGESLDSEIWALPLDWTFVSGAPVSGLASLTAKRKPEGPFARASIESGQPVKVGFVRRGKAWVRSDKTAGWLPLNAIGDGASFAKRTPRAADTQVRFIDGDLTYRVSQIERLKAGVRARFEATNSGERKARCDPRGLRLAHTGGASTPQSIGEELSTGCKTVEPGSTVGGIVEFGVVNSESILAVGILHGASADVYLPPQ